MHIPLPLKFTLATLFLCVFVLQISCKKENKLPDPLQAGWNNQAVCEVLEDNDNLRTLKCTFAPGVGHEKHYHNAHFGYTLVGGKFKITDTTGTRIVDIPTGTDFYNDFIIWHKVENIGETTAVFLIVEPK